MELLDGQAFPVVGAGAMVWNGNVWIPASSSNPLHTRDAALASLIGALNAAKETNPDAASASMLALLRGMLATFGKETTLAAVKVAAESLAQEDFATETTLAALLSAVGNLATEATLSAVKTAVDTLAGTVADGAQKVQLQGSIVELLSSSVNIASACWYYSDPVPLSAYRSVLVEIFAHSQYLAKLQWQSADGGWEDSRVYNGGGAIDFEERHPGKTVRLAILGLGRSQPYTYSIKGVQ